MASILTMERLFVSKQLNPEATGSVVFLHGSGDTGNGVRSWIKGLIGKEWQFPHLRVLYPTAPLLPYTPMEGMMSNVWFDRLSVCPEVPECLESINSSAEMLANIVKGEVESGIPIERILIGGFSMGGAMAMHMAFRFLPGVRGCFGISSFINDNSAIYENLKIHSKKPLPSLCLMHGGDDEFVPAEWGNKTLNALKSCGVDGSITIHNNVSHELNKSEIMELSEWINIRIPSS